MYKREEIEEMIHKFGDMVYRFAYIQVKNPDMADDVYQNVWLRLIRVRKKWNRRSISKHGFCGRQEAAARMSGNLSGIKKSACRMQMFFWRKSQMERC